MAAKKTPFKYDKKPLPDYEILTEEEIAQTSADNPCCNCDNPNTSWCNPEHPNGIAATSADWLGSFGAFNSAR
ncbi:MAG TPA: hypothetical protein DEB39_12410 [Planctomycetaceae bacterium]|nr:hypothetical protein [Planctomycetaceae bacterium]